MPAKRNLKPLARLGPEESALVRTASRAEARLKPPEDVRREVASRLEQLEQRVTALEKE